MECYRKDVYDALSGLCAVRQVYPRDGATLPVIVYEMTENSVSARASGKNVLQRTAFSLHIYAQSRSECDALVSGADNALSALGFSRIMAQDMFDQDIMTPCAYLRYEGEIMNDIVYQ